MTAIKFLNRPDLTEKRFLDPPALVGGVRKYIKDIEGKAQLKSTVGYLELIARNVEQALHARDNGNFYAVHSAHFPIEFFWPLGIMPLCSELYSTIVGIIGDDNQEFLSIADDIGFPCENCSYYRALYGMTEVGALPTPDFICFSSSPCDSAPKGQEMAAKYLGVPSFGLDRPYRIVTPQSMEYWLKEHQALIRFLEEQTGRRMDRDQLQEVTRLSCRAAQIYIEINELRRAVPCPMPAEAAFAPMAVYRAWCGTQTCVDFLEQLRDELRERVDRGIGAVPKEKFRYTCATSLPLFDLGIMMAVEKRYGAVNVMDHLQWWREDGDWLIDPEDPVASLAYKSQFDTANSLHGTALDHAEELRLAALKTRADGVVYFNNRGCRQAAGGHRVLEDTVARSLGIPWATIDCDLLDKSLGTFDEVMERLDDFFATVENSQPYRQKIRQRATLAPDGIASA